MSRLKARLITAGIALALVAVPALGAAGLYLLAVRVYRIGDVPLPDFPATDWVRSGVPLGAKVQGWTGSQARDFHHRSQGSVILPLSWFRALEQPVISPLEVGLFSDRSYLERFGFNYDPDPDPDPADAAAPGAGDASRLYPVGFAVEKLLFPYPSTASLEFPRRTEVIGLTCAACHTGRIDLKWQGNTRSVLIEGGSAMIDLKKFQDAMGAALFLTQFDRGRFRRFARRVLDADTITDASEEGIRVRLDSLIKFGTNQLAIIQERKLIPVEAGFGRTDALALIGNRVFGAADDENLTVANGPVNFPHVWDTAWFDWVQYNGSIRMPMARNIGEALGVMALLNIGEPDKGANALGKFRSSVNVGNIAWLERQLGGSQPFSAPPGAADPPAGSDQYGLQPPRWLDVMGDLIGAEWQPPRPLPGPLGIDPERKAEGGRLYRQFCQGCHLHPRVDLQAYALHPKDRGSYTQPEWDAIAGEFTAPDRLTGKQFLKVPVIDLDRLGTDPNQALNFHRRVAVDRVYPDDRATTGGQVRVTDKTITGETGLYWITSVLRAAKYREMGLLPREGEADARRDERREYDRYRSVPENPVGYGVVDAGTEAAARQLTDAITSKIDFGDVKTIVNEIAMADVIRAPLGYKARPLDGAWATPPYLHNGSVPTIDDLLRPVADRPAAFYVGSTLYDPARLGYDTSEVANTTRFDTHLDGNSNAGHEFRNPSLDELEQAYGIVPASGQDRTERLAHVLNLTVERLKSLGPIALRAQYDRVKRDAPRPISLKGVIGPELTDEERACLLEYLKSI